MIWFEKLRKEPQAASIAAALSLLALIGVVDLYTGTGVSLDALYLIPVALAGWFAGAGAGVGLSVAASAVWFGAHTGFQPGSALTYTPYWNALMQLAAFLAVTWLLPFVRAETTREQESPQTDYLTKTTNKRGFIALALVIFAKWNPLRAIVGALLFSGAVAFQLLMQSSGIQISPFLLDTIPYILTIIVLIAWGGTRRYAAPASLGRIYEGTE